MTPGNFQFLVKTLQNHYSTNRGIIGHMRTGMSKIPYSICVSNTRNKDKIVPTDCIVWYGDKVVYKGRLKSKRLYNKLDALNVCCMELTTAEEMERGEGKFICLGDYKTCTAGGCKCKSLAYWDKLRRKYPELDPENSIKASPVSALVTAAWKDGWRTAKRKFKREVKKKWNASNIRL